MSAAAVEALRIGEVAERVGTTPRTVRYYEEIGLLPVSDRRPHGGHRLYSEADVERLRQILQMKQLLGLSLDELGQLIEAEESRAALREEWHRAEDSGAGAETRRRILTSARGHIERQLELVRGRQRELARLDHELERRRERVVELLSALDAEPGLP
ncbi:MAG: hypothetical protein NVSMB25_19720 [Thermoleophilaceae bacterium]